MSIEISRKDELFQYAQTLGFGDLHFKFDQQTGLVAIIAIHSTKLGPALGGCRCLEYASMDDAIHDVMRLANGMTYKAAITDLPLGGGKSVLVKPKQIKDRHAYFEKFGDFIQELGGRYITAVDSGTSTKDMDDIAKVTNYVTSTTEGNGDPSPYTAEGVFYAIRAGVKFKLGKDSLSGIKIAIQGVGHVGMGLAKHCHDDGAELIVTDTNEAAVATCVNEFNATAVSLNEIYGVDCHVFSPCALGACLNDDTIPQLKANIVIGSANNQLAEPRHGIILKDRGILYGPDYVVNAGGLIHACAQFYKTPIDEVKQNVKRIFGTTMAIFERSAKDNLSTHVVADKIAEEKLNGNYSTEKTASEVA